MQVSNLTDAIANFGAKLDSRLDTDEASIAAGGGGGTASTPFGATPDTLPATANVANDEFETAALDTTGTRIAGATPWAWRNQGGAAVAQSDGALVLTLPSNGGVDNLRWLEQALPAAGTWKYRAKLLGNWQISTSNASVGMGLYNSTTGKIVSFVKLWDQGSVQGFAVTKYNSATSWSGNYYYNNSTLVNTQGSVSLTHYFEIEFDGTNYHARVSATGVEGTFIELIAFTPADFLGGLADKIYLGGNANAQQVQLVCPWFRRKA